MAASIILGLTAIRRRDVPRHRAWMTRAYALALGAATQVFTQGHRARRLRPQPAHHDLSLGAPGSSTWPSPSTLIRRPVAPPDHQAAPGDRKGQVLMTHHPNDQTRRLPAAGRGHLDQHWSAWFGGLTLTHEDDGTTSLTGAVTDQAELHGLLTKIRDLGVTLISVAVVDPAQAAP